MKLYDKDDLISIVRNAGNPIAFLVGAPLSEDVEGGVPGVSPMLALVREEVSKRDPTQLESYDAALVGKKEGDAYKSALEWLQGRFGPDAVRSVVKTAVLKARKAASPTTFHDDGVPDEWHISSGARQLASLICDDQRRSPDERRFLGPVLTTNFDPLLSLAIKSAGGSARLRVIDSDGVLGKDVKSVSEVDVVHLHGYWRDSDTHHTSTQLTAPREKLRKSLEKILNQRTLVVVAYGGWDDIFAHALAEVAEDNDSQLLVLWCFYENDAAEIERKYQLLFERVKPAVIRGRFLCYGGINCHEIFGEIAAASLSPPATTALTASPLAGWEMIDSAYLAGLQPLLPEQVALYFDGAIPTWQHAVSDTIPRRQVVSEVAERLASLRSASDGCSLQLIRAAGGEGKSTLLLQAASDAVRSGGFTVLWRPSPRVGLPPEHAINLDADKKWLIVADDAENLVEDIVLTAELLHRAGRSNVHFFLATRDADWRANSGDKPRWDKWLKAWVSPDRTKHKHAVMLRDITRKDAEEVIKAWASCGPAGLRKLNNISGLSERVDALMREVKDATFEQDEQEMRGRAVDGSFFGGLLAVRFGPDGLQTHVRLFLERLKGRRIKGSKNKSTLFDALVYVAACHAVGIPGLNENVLADLLSVPRDWILSRVVRLLGEEAAAIQSGGHVFTRHSKVAASILVQADQRLGADVGKVWSDIVRQTVKTSRRGVFIGITHAPIIHAGTQLQSNLPKTLSEQRRKEIAIAAAKAAVEAEPDRLTRLDSLAKTYRNAGDLPTAVKVFRDNFASAKEKVDYDEAIRAYLCEWGVCEGSSGKVRENALADIWLCGLSLSDLLDSAPITDWDAKVACLGLGLAFGRLAGRRTDYAFALARRAITFLGRLIPDDPKGEEHYNDFDRQDDRNNLPHPTDIVEAIKWLRTGVIQAGNEIIDSLLSDLANPNHVSFGYLESFLLKKKAKE